MGLTPIAFNGVLPIIIVFAMASLKDFRRPWNNFPLKVLCLVISQVSQTFGEVDIVNHRQQLKLGWPWRWGPRLQWRPVARAQAQGYRPLLFSSWFHRRGAIQGWAPRVQAALDAAMNNIEEDIDIDALAITNAFAVRGTRKEKSSKKASRPKSSKVKEERSKENYPESRGLVPKWNAGALHSEAGIRDNSGSEDKTERSHFLDCLVFFCLACLLVRLVTLFLGLCAPHNINLPCI